MAIYTNMAWPDDPYGTGQLWRKEPPLVAAFASLCIDNGDRALPVSYAVAYLRLHRSRTVHVTDPVVFGFRAVSAISPADLPTLVRLFDLDTMRARRLAKIIAGHRLIDDLYAAQAIADGDVGRGLRSLIDAWPSETGDDADMGGGRLALMFDVATVTQDGELADAAADADLKVQSVHRAFEPQRTLDVLFETLDNQDLPGSPVLACEQDQMINQAEQWLGLCATERALISALIAGRLLDRYTWHDALDIGAALAAGAQDCFPTQEFPTSA
jgi:hypothetical protein